MTKKTIKKTVKTSTAKVTKPGAAPMKGKAKPGKAAPVAKGKKTTAKGKAKAPAPVAKGKAKAKAPAKAPRQPIDPNVIDPKGMTFKAYLLKKASALESLGIKEGNMLGKDLRTMAKVLAQVETLCKSCAKAKGAAKGQSVALLKYISNP